jgi:NDP-sugar pyrophosphorylase family protein
VNALILAGGLGTRLQGVLHDRPKPMAPVAGRPFLEYLVLQLLRAGVERVVLSTGHLGEHIAAHFGDGAALGVRIVYSHESRPAGTGGAVKLAERHLEGDRFLVMNGDSFVAADLATVIDAHRARSALVTMALTRVADASRYGSVERGDDGRITRFVEKGAAAAGAPGLINSGIYVLERALLDRIPEPGPASSLERDLFPSLIGRPFFGVELEGFFKDIGVPDDYKALCDRPEPLLELVSGRIAQEG